MLKAGAMNRYALKLVRSLRRRFCFCSSDEDLGKEAVGTTGLTRTVAIVSP